MDAWRFTERYSSPPLLGQQKRIAAPVLNVLSGVVMPLHKLDYYDEDAIDPGDDTIG